MCSQHLAAFISYSDAAHGALAPAPQQGGR
jgi:hypothetical protein